MLTIDAGGLNQSLIVQLAVVHDTVYRLDELLLCEAGHPLGLDLHQFRRVVTRQQSDDTRLVGVCIVGGDHQIDGVLSVQLLILLHRPVERRGLILGAGIVPGGKGDLRVFQALGQPGYFRFLQIAGVGLRRFAAAAGGVAVVVFFARRFACITGSAFIGNGGILPVNIDKRHRLVIAGADLHRTAAASQGCQQGDTRHHSCQDSHSLVCHKAFSFHWFAGSVLAFFLRTIRITTTATAAAAPTAISTIAHTGK